MSTVRRIELNFPEPVELTQQHQRRLDEIAGELCKTWQEAHPGRVMWPFGVGFKITFMPLTREQEETRGIEFDDDTFEIECTERADYKWPCAKCRFEQGDHKDHITEPPAGDCEFEPKVKEAPQ